MSNRVGSLTRALALTVVASSVGGVTVEFKDLLPYPILGQLTRPEAYRATVEISRP